MNTISLQWADGPCLVRSSAPPLQRDVGVVMCRCPGSRCPTLGDTPAACDERVAAVMKILFTYDVGYGLRQLD
ncbi:hypothetical protein Hamer_G017799 [Homarus americanus]|uniref:Uncharacterized protein n=1 Tax=Homarus americanus TaxID=6706 RepID=A0A8J5T8S0_HOMAM|nr:hypothetical protein Hamer_G017799 [Homarus americanus]